MFALGGHSPAEGFLAGAAMVTTSTCIHKVIITGTGRAGTTFLVRLLTELDLDTGFNRQNWRDNYDEHCSAGLEKDLSDPDAPYIVKNPALCKELGALLASQRLVVDHAFIPIRDLESAARSRMRVGGDGSVPGGLWLTDDATKQSSLLATAFHELMHTLAVHDVPHTFLHFPRFACDPSYSFSKLQPVLHGITRRRFDTAFARVADPSLIHDFSRTPVSAPPPRPCVQTRKQTRLKRRLRRVGAYCAALAVLGACGWAFTLRRGPQPAPQARAPIMSAPFNSNAVLGR